jgi:hypothetical protein
MKSILYSICVGTLALALATGGAQAATDKNKRQERAKPQQRSANVQAARPANTGRIMAAHRNVSAAQSRQQRSYANVKPRTSSNVSRSVRSASATRATAARPAVAKTATIRNQRNVAKKTPAARPASTTPATVRARHDVAANRNRNVAVNRTRNVAANRTRNVDTNRERNVAVNRAKRPASTPLATAADVNRFRNTNEFRNRNNVAINRNIGKRGEGVASTRTNAAYYRGGNVRVTNNWSGDAFRGERYWAFRNYKRNWHDRHWWRSHYTRIIFVNSGWWYWNAGYWFPAWGYAPSVSYVYDGPIYGYNGLSPDQVTVNVQEQLAAAGYYDGPIDGVLGPMTREAIAAYQADNGLAVTSAIDEPTLATMGLV